MQAVPLECLDDGVVGLVGLVGERNLDQPHVLDARQSAAIAAAVQRVVGERHLTRRARVALTHRLELVRPGAVGPLGERRVVDRLVVRLHPARRQQLEGEQRPRIRVPLLESDAHAGVVPRRRRFVQPRQRVGGPRLALAL